MIESAVYAIIGMLFYEAIRIYRCITIKEPVIPRIGTSRRVAYFFYFAALTIFCIVAIALAVHLVPDDPLKAFMLGVGIPTGSRFITPSKNTDNDSVDDLTSELQRKPSTLQYLKTWLQHYNV